MGKEGKPVMWQRRISILDVVLRGPTNPTKCLTLDQKNTDGEGESKSESKEDSTMEN